MSESEALENMNRWAAQPMSLSATCYHDGVLMVRLSGAVAAIRSVRQKLGGEVVNDAESFWQSVREQHHDFFQSAGNLWRLSLPSVAETINTAGRQLIEWGGALRWLASDAPPATLREAAAAHGGHATLFRSNTSIEEPFHPLAPSLLVVHQRLKKTFDPHGILNPGRMYQDL
jgi:glycolate oxidase FAD binding subunit